MNVATVFPDKHAYAKREVTIDALDLALNRMAHVGRGDEP